MQKAGAREQPSFALASFLALYPLAFRVDTMSADPDYKDEPGEVVWGNRRIFYSSLGATGVMFSVLYT